MPYRNFYNIPPNAYQPEETLSCVDQKVEEPAYEISNMYLKDKLNFNTSLEIEVPYIGAL